MDLDSEPYTPSARSPLADTWVFDLKFHNRIKKTFCSFLFWPNFVIGGNFQTFENEIIVISLYFFFFFFIYWVDDKNRTMIMSAIRNDVLDTTTQTDMPNRWYRVKQERSRLVSTSRFSFISNSRFFFFFYEFFSFLSGRYFPPPSPSIHHRHRFYWILFLFDFSTFDRIRL